MNGDWRHLKLGEILVDAGAVARHSLEAALEEQKISKLRLGEILQKNGCISESQLTDALGKQLNLPLISLAKYKPSPEAMKIIPEAVAQRLEIVPLAILELERSR